MGFLCRNAFSDRVPAVRWETLAPQKEMLPFPLLLFGGIVGTGGPCEPPTGKRRAATETRGGRAAGGSPLRAHLPHVGADATPRGLRSLPPAREALAGTYLDPARRAITPARRHGTAPPRPRPRPLLPPAAVLRGRGVRGRGVRGWEQAQAQARGNRRRDARTSLAASSWGQKPRPSGGGHVIPFKDGRPVVLMNNTWRGEGVRVGVAG